MSLVRRGQAGALAGREARRIEPIRVREGTRPTQDCRLSTDRGGAEGRSGDARSPGTVTVAVVVSDTSSIRALAHLGLVDLLRELFFEALIPPAVAAELQDPPSDSAQFDVSVIPFIRGQIPGDRVQVDQFLLSLDPGESEALALALESRADLILIDEVAGRAAAQRLGLAPMGV